MSKKKKRILLFTGKGGVGKTTVAAATALRASELGYKTLLISVDPAHSLSDALEQKLGPEPKKILENLYAQEINVYYSIKKYWGSLRNYILAVFKWQNVDEVLAEELAALPGMEEGAAFLWLEKYHREGDFDLIVVDSAPTGEALTLLSLPEVTRWWMERIFPLQKRVAKTLGPAIRAVTNVPLPQNETYNAVEDLIESLDGIHSILIDPEISSIRLVLNPEKMVIQEAKKAYIYLQLYEYSVDAVVVNRIFPHQEAPFFRKYIESQEKYLKQIEEEFYPLPVFKVRHFGKEVFGMESLGSMGKQLYGEKDPTETFLKERPYKLTSENGEYILDIHLPFVKKGEISLLQYGDEIVIQIGNKRRNIFLPRFLGYYSVEGAKHEDGRLKIRFKKDKENR